MKPFVVMFALAALLGTSTAIALAKPNCYSARHCGGKIISHRDQHNCKNTGGKSWRPAPGTDCVSF
jgi:hypothetical protein